MRPEMHLTPVSAWVPMTLTLALCSDVAAVSPDHSWEKQIAEDISTRCWHIDPKGVGRHFESPGRAARPMIDAIPAPPLVNGLFANAVSVAQCHRIIACFVFY